MPVRNVPGAGRLDLYRSLVAAAFCLVIGFPYTAGAEMFFDVGVKGIYEDNIVGLLSDKSGGNGTGTAAGPGPGNGMVTGAFGQGQGPGPGPGPGGAGGGGGPAAAQPVYLGSDTVKNSDSAVGASATAGGLFFLGRDTSLFLAGSAERISYSTFTELNMTAGGLSAGVNRMIGDRVLARLAASWTVKRFGEPDRDSEAAGGSLSFKEKLFSRFWLIQTYAYERNKADSRFFSYAGNSLALRAGLDVVPSTTVLAGWQYLVRGYDEPDDFKEKADTLTLALAWEAVRRWFIDLQYDRRVVDSNFSGAAVTDNIYSLGLRYSN